MPPTVPIAIEVATDFVDFRFAEPVSLFMLAVSRDAEVVWELVANEGNVVEGGEVTITPVEQATPQMLENVQQAEVLFLARVRESPPLTTPVLVVRYGVLPNGYRESAAARALTPGRYELIGMCAQGHISGEFDVPVA
jgi:hypothetical protein